MESLRGDHHEPQPYSTYPGSHQSAPAPVGAVSQHAARANQTARAIVASCGRVGPAVRYLCRGATVAIGLYATEATARRCPEPVTQGEPTGVYRIDRKRRGSPVGVFDRV